MSRQIRILCGVPDEHCSGTKLSTDQHFSTHKAHIGHVEAFRCMAKYLTKVLGYKRVGSREFAPPDGGPIRILSKQTKYGGLLVTGKLQERFMPEKRVAGNRGVIV